MLLRCSWAGAIPGWGGSLSQLVFAHPGERSAPTRHIWDTNLKEQQESDLNEDREKTMAPDFALPDYRGHLVKLSDFRGKRHVVLVFNRGFG
jgi:hypothetical protein